MLLRVSIFLISKIFVHAMRIAMMPGYFTMLVNHGKSLGYLQLHLRRVGVEARPDLLQGIPRYDGGAGSSNSGGSNSGSHFDNNRGDPHGGQNGGDDLQDFGSESHDSDGPVPTSTMYDSLALCTFKFAISEGLYAHLLLQQLCVAFCLCMIRSKASLIA
jgi:hypothetical protein